ncbi:MAG: PDZ domain-containing protein [Oscillospiraceae bacterium]|nr:PDZ domain-containing protein [Oscillospiraceae bacterium]MBQ8245432.1 PDZ domain-containing protein [Oscillospiraceae bacterium]
MLKRIANRLFISFAFFVVCAVPVCAAQTLVPVGEVIGLELRGDAVTVSAFDQALPAGKDAGLRIGDEILAIDGYTIDSAADIRHALNRADGDVDVVVSRDGRETALRVEPDVTPDGPRLGVYLRQGVTGIGTVTFYDPATGAFGTLGHGVNDPKGNLLAMTAGNVYPAGVAAIDRGQAGRPGQLRGSLANDRLLGTISKNTEQGVFGQLHGIFGGEAIPVGTSDCVTAGAATIRSTVDGSGPRDYSVEILKIYPETRADGRNLLLRVTDPQLLQATGGIVQGMSGSPIIQNGKLIGAVTHVLVNEPTTGYGIFIENMLDAAS